MIALTATVGVVRHCVCVCVYVYVCVRQDERLTTVKNNRALR